MTSIVLINPALSHITSRIVSSKGAAWEGLRIELDVVTGGERG